jgi:cell wall assembly regulator SMI1
MRLVDIVRAASQQPFTTEDGDPDQLVLDPPVSGDKLRELESRLPCPIPPDVRELLNFCAGFSGGMADFVDFTGQRCSFEFKSAFPHGLPIAADGSGNFWVVDLLPSSTKFGPIYYACHDAPVILYQSQDIEEFLTELFKVDLPPFKSLVSDVHIDRLFEVWRKNPGVRGYDECLASGDRDLYAFAQELGGAYRFIDLRNPAVGFGFSWGRYGPNTIVRRHGDLPIFAYKKPIGILSRLFG